MTGKNKIIFGIVILWTCVIWTMSLQPAEVSSDFSSGIFGWIIRVFLPDVWERMDEIPVSVLEMWHTVFRKFAHFTEYFILGALWTLAWVQRDLKGKCKPVGLICVLTALVDEMLIQRVVPGRSGQLSDVLLDSIGAVAGMFFMWIAVDIGYKIYKRRKANDF